nr:hypothetical protein Ccrd_007580 [Ipomoea batatas]
MESNSQPVSGDLNSAAQGTSSSRLEIHKHRTGDIPAAGSLIEIDVDALELEVINGGVAVAALVAAGRINAVLVADNFPELGANLVAALASLNQSKLGFCLGNCEAGIGKALAVLLLNNYTYPTSHNCHDTVMMIQGHYSANAELQHLKA